MTDETMALKALLEKTSDADLLNEMIGFAANQLMALEADGSAMLAGTNARLIVSTITRTVTDVGDPRRDG